MENKIKGILIDVKKGSFSVLEIEDTLKEYYRILNCDCIDIVTRCIGCHECYKIVCDDNAFLKSNIPSVFDIDGNVHLVGNVFIVSNFSVDGELNSLDDEDIEYLQDFIDNATLKEDGRIIKVLTGIC